MMLRILQRAGDERRRGVEHPVAPALLGCRPALMHDPGIYNAERRSGHHQWRCAPRPEVLSARFDDADREGFVDMRRKNEVAIVRMKIIRRLERRVGPRSGLIDTWAALRHRANPARLFRTAVRSR